MWHQVLVNHNGKYGKTESLSAIFNSLHSHEFYPCYYQTGDKRDSFFIRNCFDQMDVLYMDKLKVQIPFTNEVILLTYKMNVANFKKVRRYKHPQRKPHLVTKIHLGTNRSSRTYTESD